MNQQQGKMQLLIFAALILLAVLTRLMPALPNFSPIIAIAIMSGLYFKDRILKFLVPLSALLISDVLVNNVLYADHFEQFTVFYSGFYWTYGCIALFILLTDKALMQKFHDSSLVQKSSIVGGSALLASVIFFLVSNFGVWVSGSLYPMTWSGLVSAYAFAIPFFHMNLLGNLVFAGILFGAFEFIKLSMGLTSAKPQ